MRAIQRPKLLYFTAGSVPTEAELDEVSAYTARFRPVVRNGSMVPAEGNAENCSAVAGTVPALYRHVQHADDFDPNKDPKLGSIRTDHKGNVVVRELSARDGTAADRTLFAPPREGLPAFNPPKQAEGAAGWKPNA